MKKNIKTGYFAKRDKKDCVAALNLKIDTWTRTYQESGYLNKLRDLYSAYYGAGHSSIGDAHQITFGGEDEELVEIVVNNLRNIGQHMHVMTTSTRPAMEARAANTDYRSQVQTTLANGLLDYYMREKKLEKYLMTACEYAISLAGGWIKLAWNSRLGEVTNRDEIQEATLNKKKIPEREFQGDIEYKNLSQLDVIMDLTREDDDHDWLIARTFKNRYDLIATYPEFEDELMKIDNKSSLDRVRFGNVSEEETDDIPVYEFYHKKTESIPDGRYILFVSEDGVLYDGEMPYRKIPLFNISPAKILGTGLGYTPLFDLIPIQEATNMLYSTGLTNISAFGVQNVLVPQNCNIDVNQMSGGLNFLYFNPAAGEPKSMNLTEIPQELFRLIQMFDAAGETITGINSVVRGNPEASLRSGSALGLIHSQAIQFMSGLQAEYTHLIEDVGLATLEMLIDFADSPRVADLVGVSGRSYVDKFKGEDLSEINRVIVDSANPLTRTIAGRTQMADNLMQYSQGKITPEQYINVINTGKLEVATEGIVNEELLIRGENESMLQENSPIAMWTDSHLNHIKAHRTVLFDPKMRENPQLAERIIKHIQDHIDLLQSTDPQKLMLLGEQPLQPQQTPPPQGQPDNATPPEEMEVPTNLPPEAQGMALQEGHPQGGVRIPEGVEEMPMTPEENLERIGR